MPVHPQSRKTNIMTLTTTGLRVAADRLIAAAAAPRQCDPVRDILGSPLNALRWLARTAQENGSPLRAGHILLSGALDPMVPVRPGSTYVAEIDGVGSVEVSFAEVTR